MGERVAKSASYQNGEAGRRWRASTGIGDGLTPWRQTVRSFIAMLQPRD